MRNIGMEIVWIKVLEEAKLLKAKKGVETAAEVIFDAHELGQISNQQGLFCINSLLAN